MRKIKKYWPIVVVVCLGLVVNIGIYYYRNYIRVRVLSKAEVRTILEQNLDKKLLALPAEYAGFAWKDKKYVFIVFQYTAIPDLPASLCFEVVGNAAVNYDLNGKMPVKYSSGCKEHKITLEDLTDDNIPEFVYYTDCCEGSGNFCYQGWDIIDIAARVVVSGDWGGGCGPYAQAGISLSDNADQHPKIREYLLSQISIKQQQEQARPKKPYEILVDYWYKHNGIKCTMLDDFCQVKLLWIDYPGNSDWLSEGSVFSEDSDNEYKAIAEFKDAIYLIDQKANKIALIYLPECKDFYKVRLLGDWVIITNGQHIIRYEIKTCTLSQLAPKFSAPPLDQGKPQQLYKVLWEIWYRHNELASNFNKVHKLKLLWLDYPGFDEFFCGGIKSAEDSLDHYTVVSLFRDGVYLIDNKKKKIALIYMPPVSDRFDNKKVVEACKVQIAKHKKKNEYGVILHCGKNSLFFHLNTRNLVQLSDE